MKTIYLIRHGEIEGCKPRRFIGRTDLPMTSRGADQLEALGKHLAGFGIEKVFTSPLLRCMGSAEILKPYCEGEFEVCDDLAEIHLGEWEGLSVAEVKQRFPGGYEARGGDICSYTPPGGESFSDLQRRVVPVFEEIVQKMQNVTAVVAHAGVNRVLLCHILGIPLGKMFMLGQDYGCYNRICIGAKGIRLDCLNRLP